MFEFAPVGSAEVAASLPSDSVPSCILNIATEMELSQVWPLSLGNVSASLISYFVIIYLTFLLPSLRKAKLLRATRMRCRHPFSPIWFVSDCRTYYTNLVAGQPFLLFLSAWTQPLRWRGEAGNHWYFFCLFRWAKYRGDNRGRLTASLHFSWMIDWPLAWSMLIAGICSPP